MAACRQGGKVLVLTVDPARRLANALGLSPAKVGAQQVPLSAFAKAGIVPRGELWTEMLDTKWSWDRLVSQHAPDTATAQRILDNPLYQNISGRFVQSHDYIAVERLYELHSQGAYDLIVVDTPPTRNAIDFLLAPERMAEFFSSRLLRLLTVPYRSRFADMASRPFYHVAEQDPGFAVPPGHRRVLHTLPNTVGGFCGPGRGGPAAPGRPPLHVYSGEHLGEHPGA